MGIMRVDLADTTIEEPSQVAGRSKSIIDMGIMRVNLADTRVDFVNL